MPCALHKERDACHPPRAGNRHGEGRTLDYLGLVLRHTEGIEAARDCWRQALVIFAELGAPEAEEIRVRLEQHDPMER